MPNIGYGMSDCALLGQNTQEVIYWENKIGL